VNRRPTRILLVEDDPSLRELLHDALTDEGFTVVRVEHGGQALAEANVAPPDLVLTDLMLPVMDGQELAHHLREQPSTASTPILLITAAFPLPASDEFTIILPKPFDLARLLSTIHKLVDS
jgi:CheY-like chemotaxis protein